MLKYSIDPNLDIDQSTAKKQIDELNSRGIGMRDSDPIRAIDACREAYRLARKLTPKYELGMATSTYNLSLLCFHISEYNQALQQAFESLEIYRQLKLKDMESLILRHIGRIYESLANYSEALSYTFDALELCESEQDTAGAARNLTRLGTIYHQLNKYPQELECYTKALQAYQELKEDEGMAVIFNRMARAYIASNEFTNAVIYARNSLQLAQDIDEELLETEVHCTLGEVYARLDSFSQSALHFDQAIKRATRLSYPRIVLEAKLGLGQLYVRQSMWENAVKILEEALASAAETQSRRFLFTSHEVLAQAYEELGNYEKSLYHYKQFHLTEKAVFNDRTEQQLNNLQVLHETEQARKEAEVYELQNIKLANEIAERKRNQEAAEQANRKLASRIEDLSTLNLIAQSLATATDLDIALQDVALTAVLLTHSSSILVATISTNKKRLDTLYQYAYCEEEWPTVSHINLHNNPLWKDAIDLQQIASRDSLPDDVTSEDPYHEFPAERANLTYQLCVPLRTRDDIVGAITLTRHADVGGYSATSIQLVETIAGLLAVALDNSRLFKSEQNQRVIAETRNEELDAFARTVAHDLKNPLSALMSSAEFLENYHHLVDKERLEEIYRIMHSSSVKATSIVEELLLLAGVRKQEVEISALDMSHIVVQAKQRLSNMTADLDGEWILPERWPTASGYGPWIEEVWANYMSNAIKYGGRPYRIELGADQLTDQSVRFWIKDNGKGIPDQAKSELFSEFSRLNQKKIEGHGLGLSIVKRIVEKLGGEVGYERNESSSGSLFYFTLPTLG